MRKKKVSADNNFGMKNIPFFLCVLVQKKVRRLAAIKKDIILSSIERFHGHVPVLLHKIVIIYLR
jgi:hypothetical protein